MKHGRRYAGLAILVAVGAALAVAWFFRQPRADDVAPGASAPAVPEAAKSPTAAAEPAERASPKNVLDAQSPADCLAALAAPEASSRLLREQRQRAIERFLEQQGDERKQALIADLAGYTLPGLEEWSDGFTYVSSIRYWAPHSASEQELSGDERLRLRALLETEGVEALIATVDPAMLQASWTPGTSFIEYLMQEHGERLWAALPAVADSLPVGVNELATAIASDVSATDFALLLDAAEVDPAAAWLNGGNLAMVAAIHIRPQILRLLTIRGVNAADRPPWGYGTILDDIAANAKPEKGASAALADVVRQLVAAGAQPELPSTLRTLGEWLPEVPLPPLHQEAAALADSLGDAVAAVAAMDADWTQKIDAASQLEQRCEAQLADAEHSATAFQATDLVAKQRYQEVLQKQRERAWKDTAEQSQAEDEPAAAEGQALSDAFLLALQDDRWRDAMAIADQIGGHMQRAMLEIALRSAPLDVILELAQRHGSLPEDAILSLPHLVRGNEATIAEALEPFGLDPHYVNEMGENVFTRLARYFYSREGGWQFVEYLASRQVAVKPQPYGLDPLDYILMDMVAWPVLQSEGRVRFARFLIDHGAPVEASHLELAGQLLAKDEEAYRRLVDAVPELATRAPGG